MVCVSFESPPKYILFSSTFGPEHVSLNHLIETKHERSIWISYNNDVVGTHKICL